MGLKEPVQFFLVAQAAPEIVGGQVAGIVEVDDGRESPAGQMEQEAGILRAAQLFGSLLGCRRPSRRQTSAM